MLQHKPDLEHEREDGGVQRQKAGWKTLGAQLEKGDWRVDKVGGYLCNEGSTNMQPGGLDSNVSSATLGTIH